MKYAIETRCFDNGKVSVSDIQEYPLNDCPDSFAKEMQNYDYYFDVFDTREEAEKFKKQEI